ncbi:ABC transporter permease subunit [Arthrobacter sp. I2-34]|uniref:ABC transporter permease subunit n=1 Tax=Arthrobacter hankyongi TaxID=2904801 RepID=A0ABS9L483_9MICC|nr:ABC transporter permease subunit [Arthrobacter hankyongi]MCG2621378.1 ABC transporter permease subunit [Arthrobacter hankyongi]
MNRKLRLPVSAGGVAAALALWQLIATGPMAGGPLPTVADTFAELAGLLAGGAFWAALADTLVIALAGLAAAAAAGVVTGVLIGSFEPVRYATAAVLEFLKPIPPIVILPLVVLIFGPTTPMSWFLVFFGCVLPIIMQTVAGVHDADPVTLDTARSYGLGRVEILARVTLPSAMPFIGTAMRVAAPAALIITVVAGLLGGGPGLGRSIYQAQASGDYPVLYAYVVVLGVLGLAFQGASALAERRLLHWHASYREVLTP